MGNSKKKEVKDEELKNKAGKDAAAAAAKVAEEQSKEQKAEPKEKGEQKVKAEEKKTEAPAKEEEKAEVSKEEALGAKLAEVNDKYIRLAAEFDNYRRRVAKEKLDIISTAGEDVIKGLLPVLDDCERALQVLNNSLEASAKANEGGSDQAAQAMQAAREGTELIYNKLMNYLKGRGLAAIEAVGKELDTDFHEAVAQFPVPEKEKKNRIIDVTQQGYTLNGKVIRFAKVVVGI